MLSSAGFNPLKVDPSFLLTGGTKPAQNSSPSISHGVGVPLEEGRDSSSATCWPTIICDPFWFLPGLTTMFTPGRHGALPLATLQKSKGPGGGG